MKKLGRKQMPCGYAAASFKYMGRPAKGQGDFGDDVGIADMACVNQFGVSNNAKYYHGGVVEATDGTFWVYLEWGRMKAAKSWDSGGFGGGDFQFAQCSDEAEARKFFAKQMNSKNTKRLEHKMIEGVEMWAGKNGKDGYIVQSLATREKGLPDARQIKDNEGVAKTGGKKAATKAKASKSAGNKRKAKAKTPTVVTRTYHDQVVKLARDLVGGVQTYTRSLAAASGVTPTMGAITQVRDQLIPAAMKRIKYVGTGFPTPEALVAAQVADPDLRALSTNVNSIIPRPIPRGGWTDAEAILNSDNLLALQADLDAFEAALTNEDFSYTAPTTTVDPDSLLNAVLRWIDPKGTEGRWLWKAFMSMSNDRHSYLRKMPKVKGLYAIKRGDRDAAFMANVRKVAAKRKGQVGVRANLQPFRTDLDATEADLFTQANVVLGIHGTRPVNIAPIMGTNFRLPKSLPGAQITGANFGHGVYFATDWRKSYGYTGRGYWGNSGGGVGNRGCFMFLNDMIMGNAYRAPSTGSWGAPPKSCSKCAKPAKSASTSRSRWGRQSSTTRHCSCGGTQTKADSVFGIGGDGGHGLENDEHVIFDPNYQQIRYLIEFDWLT